MRSSFLSWPCRDIITGTAGATSELWDIRQSVRTLAEDIVKIHYEETTSDYIEDFMCAAVNDLYSV
jgi:hypothetical protein